MHGFFNAVRGLKPCILLVIPNGSFQIAYLMISLPNFISVQPSFKDLCLFFWFSTHLTYNMNQNGNRIEWNIEITVIVFQQNEFSMIWLHDKLLHTHMYVTAFVPQAWYITSDKNGLWLVFPL